jgi:hypothetical protein
MNLPDWEEVPWGGTGSGGILCPDQRWGITYCAIEYSDSVTLWLPELNRDGTTRRLWLRTKPSRTDLEQIIREIWFS